MTPEERAARALHDSYDEEEIGVHDAVAAEIRAAVEEAVTCPFCDHGPRCSSEYICEGCYHEKIADAEHRGAEEEREACAVAAQCTCCKPRPDTRTLGYDRECAEGWAIADLIRARGKA